MFGGSVVYFVVEFCPEVVAAMCQKPFNLEGVDFNVDYRC
jgi:hypothetical protein